MIINRKYGGTGGGVETVEWHQCPEAVRNYLANVTYSASDYSVSQIETYLTNIPADSKPIGKTIDGKTYYNAVPNIETPFASENTAGTIKPLDTLRLIDGGTYGANIRDLGGWACDGGTVRYGKLIRGADVYETDQYIRPILVDGCGVRMELDLKGAEESQNRKKSALGNIGYCCPETYVWYSLTNTAAWREILRCLFDCVAQSIPVYYHCSAGMDRTGTVSCIVEAILGISQSDIDKDYELSSFAGTAYLKKRNNSAQWGVLIGQINSLTVGTTFRDKIINWVASLGFTAAEINAFRAAMIDGTPETVTPTIAEYTVTKTASNATVSGETTATQYQEYTATIAPANGYALSEIQVTMGGVDITGDVFGGEKTVLRRSVVNTLSHCTTNNTRASVIDRQGYGATLTANEGYTLDGATVTIKMGGVDVSTYYSGGKISIPNVTGNIVITATAVASALPYTNLADPTSADWKTGYRISSTSISAQAGKTVSNPVPVVKGDVIRVKGVDFEANADRYQLTGKNASGTDVAERGYISVLPNVVLGYSHADGIHTFTVIYTNLASDGALCFAFTTPTDAGVVIITKNEEITD